LAVVEAQEAKATMEAAMDAAEQSRAAEVQEAKVKALADYRNSEEFTALLDKEVMDLVYRFKRYNADKKLSLNFLQDPLPLPEGVTEEMMEALQGELGMLISTGTTASVPKEREKRVLPVDLRYDVLMAHSASSSISGNSPFAAPSFFFS
ncbi:unnamed protein product, partial [Prunus brigantina]